MPDGEPLVWYADSDDPYYTLRHSGGPMVVISLLPAILVCCFAGGRGTAGAALLLLLVPPAVVAGVWEFARDRRAVVEIRLAGGELTLVRANRRTAGYPVGELRRVEMVRAVSGGDPTSSRLRLYLGERVERTRSGPADLPDSWLRAITAAEVDLRIREKHEDA